jgi:hypothetical protein
VMQWRDDCIIPRHGAAGARKFAFHVSAVSRTRSRRAEKRHSRARRSFRPLGFRSVSTPSTGSEKPRAPLSIRYSGKCHDAHVSREAR